MDDRCRQSGLAELSSRFPLSTILLRIVDNCSTTSEDGRRHLIDEKRSVALLPEGK
jgi:hypothetical protein